MDQNLVPSYKFKPLCQKGFLPQQHAHIHTGVNALQLLWGGDMG